MASSWLQKGYFTVRIPLGLFYKTKLDTTKQQIAELQKELNKDYATLQADHSTLGAMTKNPNTKEAGLIGAGLLVLAAFRALNEVQLKVQQFTASLQQKQNEKIQIEKSIQIYVQKIKDQQLAINHAKEEKLQLELKLNRLLAALPKEFELVSTPLSTPDKLEKPPKLRIGMDGVGAQDFIKQNFTTFSLPSNLGTFLGQLERNMLFITLIGDAGAGKSTLTMSIGQKFDQAGFKVIFFSLELGKSEPLQKMIKRCPASNRFRIVCSEDEILKGKTPIEAVREAASHYDVIMIDSFGKLNCKTEELDKLRNDFPETIFLSIAQKTKDGGIRGGAAVSFDSSMVINVVKEEDKESGEKKRVAIMQKSRYGTQDSKYYIEEDWYVAL